MTIDRFHLSCLAAVAAVLVAAMPAAADDKPDKTTSARKPAKAKKALADEKARLKEIHVELPDAKAALADELIVKWTTPPGTIGVTVAPTDDVLRDQLNLKIEQPGVVVTRVLKDSPAAKAGVNTNDILLLVNDKPIASGTDLKNRVRAAKDKAVKLKVLRKAKLIDVIIAPAVNWKTANPKVHGFKFARVDVFYPGGSKYIIGVNTKPVDATLAAQLVIPPSTGRVITQVHSKKPAEKAGLKEHDVILTVNDKYVSDSSDIGKVLDNAAGKPVKIEFLRAGRKHSASVTPTKRAPRDGRLRLWDYPHYPYGGASGYPYGGASGSRTMEMARGMGGGMELFPGTAGIGYGGPAASLKSQVDRLSRQLSELQKTVEALRKALPAKAKKTK